MKAILSAPRSGGHMLLGLLESCGLRVGEFPDRLPKRPEVALVHHHYVATAPVPTAAVLLERTDVVAAAVSWEVAHTGRGDWFEGRTDPVDVDEGTVIRLASQLVDARQIWREYLSIHGIPTVVLTYADLCEGNWGAAVRHLGGDPEKAEVTTAKQGNVTAEVYGRGIRRLLSNGDT